MGCTVEIKKSYFFQPILMNDRAKELIPKTEVDFGLV